MWVDGPDFEEHAAVQTRVAAGDLRGFVEIVSENEPVAADHFLGFTKRAVCYHILSHDRFTFIRESLTAPHFSLMNQLIKPGVEFADGVLYFLSREGFVPVSPGNYQVFGWSRSFAHNVLSPRLVDNPVLRLAHTTPVDAYDVRDLRAGAVFQFR